MRKSSKNPRDKKFRRGIRNVHPDLIFEKAYELARQTELEPLTKKTSKAVAKLTAELFLIMRKVNQQTDQFQDQSDVEDLLVDIADAMDQDEMT